MDDLTIKELKIMMKKYKFEGKYKGSYSKLTKKELLEEISKIKSIDEEKKECYICFNDFNKNEMFKVCHVCNNNGICLSCIAKIANENDISFGNETNFYFKTKCPYCRTVNTTKCKISKFAYDVISKNKNKDKMIIKKLQEEVISLKNKNHMLTTILNQFVVIFREIINGAVNVTNEVIITRLKLYYDMVLNMNSI
jgi:phage FluMu protein Com